MFNFIEGLGPDILAVEASGPITHADYHDRLGPRVDLMIGKGRIKALYVIHDDATELSPAARWDDQMFSIKHWHDFSHVALVTNLAWARLAATLLGPFFPAKIRVFTLKQLAEAEAWLKAAA